ncbi:GntR family transcriptional regulator [Bacillus glycinifermentans]|uniref:Transcriptional regulator PhoB n=1 Tax=Bacillus glycinifermentans TaxID=1664069 RepID=A0AAJ4D488_9BACI|nr:MULTISPECIES: GntR family transcriptional regulator [Bacillus]KKB74352.1 GntR family transcriptional regulator [Bacillus sp. TH008]KMM55728.1 GntR family transcriptional regulator [Bacillus glycinifermentans]MDU0073234.1 GntR family transcriptional regulator [Bacillus sp. IG6]MEC0493013.1 GntR family transcriptional regulator [Bacillus glycinifermentans]MEC0539026.1 GntR family transcriptional regulator [Bacillus glycinifermentans]
MLNNDSSKPLYVQLKQIISDDIKRGIYSPSEKLPAENELCEIYNVSRITVRKAISDLVEEGYLTRQQGKGTFVKSPKMKRELVAVNGYSEYMMSTGKTPRHKVISAEKKAAPRHIAKRLQLPPESPVLELKRILFNDDMPFTFDITHYPLSRFPDIDRFISDSVSMHHILKTEYQVSPAYNTKLLNVVFAKAEDSKHLACDIGDALFEIDKVAYGAEDDPIYCSLFLMHTNRVTFTINSSQA